MRETDLSTAPETSTGTGAVSSGDEGAATRGPATEVDRLRFELLRSALYHDMRERTLIRRHKGLTFLNVLLGSSAIVAFGATWPELGQAAGVAVAAVAAGQLVWDLAGMARDHRDLKKRFYNLLADVEGGASIEGITPEMTRIYADEPPISAKTNNKAHDQAGKSLFGDNFTRADGRRPEARNGGAK